MAEYVLSFWLMFTPARGKGGFHGRAGLIEVEGVEFGRIRAELLVGAGVGREQQRCAVIQQHGGLLGEQVEAVIGRVGHGRVAHGQGCRHAVARAAVPLGIDKRDRVASRRAEPCVDPPYHRLGPRLVRPLALRGAARRAHHGDEPAVRGHFRAAAQQLFVGEKPARQVLPQVEPVGAHQDLAALSQLREPPLPARRRLVVTHPLQHADVDGERLGHDQGGPAIAGNRPAG